MPSRDASRMGQLRLWICLDHGFEQRRCSIDAPSSIFHFRERIAGSRRNRRIGGLINNVTIEHHSRIRPTKGQEKRIRQLVAEFCQLDAESLLLLRSARDVREIERWRPLPCWKTGLVLNPTCLIRYRDGARFNRGPTTPVRHKQARSPSLLEGNLSSLDNRWISVSQEACLILTEIVVVIDGRGSGVRPVCVPESLIRTELIRLSLLFHEHTEALGLDLRDAGIERLLA